MRESRGPWPLRALRWSSLGAAEFTRAAKFCLKLSGFSSRRDTRVKHGPSPRQLLHPCANDVA